MRILIGVIGVLAACVFIGQSAVTLGQTAFDMASGENVWRPWLMAAGASSVVIYEGIGLVFAGLLWYHGQRWLAAGCCLLVLAAAVYTVRLELAYNVTGQADRIAERQASSERRTASKSDLARLRKEREAIGVLRPPEAIKAELASYREHNRWISTSGCTNATVPDSISYCAQYHTMQAQYASSVRLSEINKRIAELQDQQQWVPVNAGAAPDAAWASRTFGGDAQSWMDAFMVFGILFWVLARTLALPIAIGAMAGVRRNEVPEPVQAARTDQQSDEPDMTNVVSLPSSQSKPDDDLVHEAVEQARSEGCKTISFADLTERVRVLAQDRDAVCPYDNYIGARMAELGFNKKRVRNGDTQQTVYLIGLGGGPKALAEAA